MKKAIIASLLVALTSGAAITAFALRGPDKLVDLRVNAGPIERSVTFDESNNTTVEAVDKHYAIGTTTAAGTKVGVVGWHNEQASFTFKGVSFRELRLSDYIAFTEGDACQFSTITGFAISFSGKGEQPEGPEGPEEPVDMNFESMDEFFYMVESGHEYKGLSIAPDDGPMFTMMMGSVTITSLTIWYSC